MSQEGTFLADNAESREADRGPSFGEDDVRRLLMEASRSLKVLQHDGIVTFSSESEN